MPMGHDARCQILQHGEPEQAAFTGKLDTFTANSPAFGNLLKVFRPPFPEVREDGLGFNFHRFGLGPGCLWRGCEMSARQFNEFSTGIRF